MNLKQKMIAGAAIVTIVPVLLTGGLIGYQAVVQSQSALENEARDKLTSLMNARREQIESYLNTMTDQLRTFANNRMVIDAMQQFSQEFDQIAPQLGESSAYYNSFLRRHYNKDFAEIYAQNNPEQAPAMNEIIASLEPTSVARQYQYIANNSFPIGKKNQLNAADDNSEYSQIHGYYHTHFNDYLNTFGYYDIFLVDSNNGNIVYSVYKEIDYATSLETGPFSNSGLGQAYAAANLLKQAGEFSVIDYQPYVPSYNDQAMFLATPIFENGNKVGILIFQAPIDRINAVMTSNRDWESYGLGQSGETYLVGQDGLMRNDSRFLIEEPSAYLAAIETAGTPANIVAQMALRKTSIGLQKVDTAATRAANNGETGFTSISDYRGIQVLSAYTPIRIPGLQWSLMAEIDALEAFEPTTILKSQVTTSATSIGIIVVILGGLVSFFFVRNLTRSINGFESAVRKVMGGDRTARSTADTDDEIGQFGRSLNQLLDEHAGNLTRSEEENELLNDSIIELLEASGPLRDKDLSGRLPVKEDVTGALASAVNQTIAEIAETLNDVNRIANAVEGASINVKNQSDSVSNSAQEERKQLAETLDKLSQASQVMARIADLGSNCNDLAGSASINTQSAFESVNETVRGLDEIRETIHETEKRLKRLGERSQDINSTVAIINNIAERTHVLALNASMQAAAAGESGRAFAVIADEVQRLAESARDATSQITGLVENIQSETRLATEAMGATVSNVVAGSKVASVAGEQMNATREAAQALVVAVQEIAKRSSEGVDVSDELIERAKTLQLSVQSTHEQLQLQDIETTNLLEFSQKLLHSVQQFVLPKTDETDTSVSDTRAA